MRENSETMPLAKGARVAVFGGSGFIGRYIVGALAQAGYELRVCVRRPNRALPLKMAGRVGQVELYQTNICDAESVARALTNVDAIVNAVGIMVERGTQKFAAVQAEGAKHIAQAAAAQGIKKCVHISALGADAQAPSRYARSKAEGESALRRALPDLHILRPSLVVGAEDDFFNRFATLARFAPALPLIGGGATRFQPIGVGDVATAVARCFTAPPQAGIYEIGGAQVFTFRELMELMGAITARPRPLVPMPYFMARIIALLAQFMPKPLLTPDQILLLQSDNIVSENAQTLAAFDITPTPIQGLLPDYLARFKAA